MLGFDAILTRLTFAPRGFARTRARATARSALAGSPGPAGIAMATVAAITATGAIPAVRSVPDLGRELGPRFAGQTVVLAITVALALAVARLGLAGATERRARVALALGGASAGAAATFLAYRGVLLVRGFPADVPPSLQIVGSIGIGGAFGLVFGCAFAPVVETARKAMRKPSHDGADRVLFAAGASLLVVGAARARLSPGIDLDAVGCAVAAAGALAMALSAARVVGRIRLVARAREGTAPGFHLVPASGAEDEATLVPFVRTAQRPAGVLVATGLSAPYRGARGIFKLALAPLPEQRFDRLLATLARAVVAEVASAISMLAVAAVVVVLIAPFVWVFVAVAMIPI